MAWGASPTVGTASSADRGSAGTVNLTPGAPSGSGGILLLLVSSRNQPTSFTTPTGWTAIANSASQRNAVYARVSDGGANDTPTMAVVLAAGGCATATITRWTGGNTTLGSLLDGTVSSLYGSSPGGIDVPSKTPSVNNCLVLRGGLTKNDSDGPYYAAPSGDTFLCEDTHASGYGEDIWACWVYRIQTTAATVSAGQIDSNKTSSDSYSISLALTEGVTTTKYVKILADSPAASATGVEVVVYSAPSGSNYITGTTRYGSINAQEFEASLESGSAVLKVLASDVGCSALAASTTVAAQARNSTYTTGMVEATIIEE